MKTIVCGADTLVRETLEARAGRASAGAIFAVIIGSFKVIVATLREIFDESAYQRFLDRSRLESSPHAYAIFQQETEQAKSQRPRCC
jgi:hypothetical protein